MNINNTVYERLGFCWWDDDAPFEFASLRHCVNPARYRYFTKALNGRPGGRHVLDVGCGGGFLSESFARDGFQVSAIDPAAASVEAARQHATAGGLAIDYRVARGESLPCPDASFDVVACCDVLEHVDDPVLVVREVARVLKPGGMFLFDTVNRTRKSRFALITLWQDLDIIRLREPNVHVWEKFITPEELGALLEKNGMQVGEMRGLAPRANPLALLWTFLRVRWRRLPNRNLSRAFAFTETADLSVSYMGTARKIPVFG